MGLYGFIYPFVFVMIFSHAGAFKPVDPTGNITIKWDILSWTPDGYVAVVTITNYQKHRQIKNPGWTIGWTWAKKEFIWLMVGAQAIEQGDCSKFKGYIPHSCKRNPEIVDLLPGVPYNQQIANCCKGGVLSAWGKNFSTAVSAFQLTVGSAGTTNKTVRLPNKFTFRGGYTCSRAAIVPPSVFLSSGGLRRTRAIMTWNVKCTYS